MCSVKWLHRLPNSLLPKLFPQNTGWNSCCGKSLLPHINNCDNFCRHGFGDTGGPSHRVATLGTSMQLTSLYAISIHMNDTIDCTEQNLGLRKDYRVQPISIDSGIGRDSRHNCFDVVSIRLPAYFNLTAGMHTFLFDFRHAHCACRETWHVLIPSQLLQQFFFPLKRSSLATVISV